MAEYFQTSAGRRIAYHKSDGQGPAVVFCGGFMSDMEGSKAVHLEAWARRTGRAFLRFDYSGHGQSEGEFADGTIGAWAEDAGEVINGVIGGPVVLVGSSMGGWISLLLTRDRVVDVVGLVTIAAAPDFTEDSMWAGFDAATRAKLMETGAIKIPSDYDDPYTVTRGLIEDGRKRLVLRAPLRLDMPVRMLQGTADVDVDQSVALRLLDHAEGGDIRLTLVKGADHRFSDGACLQLIEKTVEKTLARA